MRRVMAMVLALLLIGSVLVGCSRPSLKGDNVALVGGEAISRQELDMRLKILELFFRQPVNDTASQQQMLDQMVREELLKAQAKNLGITVTDERVEAEMAKFFGTLERQYQTREEVNRRFVDMGVTNEMVAQFLKNYLISQEVVEKKRAEVILTEAEVKAAYEQAKDSAYTFKEPVVRAAHVLVPMDQEQMAKEIAAKVDAGGDFAELAKLYSVDPGSARSGGDLGYFTRGNMVAEFAEAAFALQVGEVSQPVRSQFGWHIIKLLDRQGPGVLPLEKASVDLTNRLLPEKQDKFVQQWLVEVEKAVKVEKATLVAAK